MLSKTGLILCPLCAIREFVVFHGEQVYPEYVVSYRRTGAPQDSSEPRPEPTT